MAFTTTDKFPASGNKPGTKASAAKKMKKNDSYLSQRKKLTAAARSRMRNNMPHS